MSVHALLVAVAAATGSWQGAAPAPAAVVIVSDDETIAVTEEADGRWTGSLSIANVGASAARVEATSAADGCAVAASPAEIPGQRQRVVTLTLTGCGLPGGSGVPLSLSVDGVVSDFTAAPGDDAADVDLRLLWWFLVAVGVAAAIMAWALVLWVGRAPEGEKRTLRTGLPYLAPTWSLKDSWASNATAVTAAVAGIFGVTEVTSSVLGDAAEDTVATVLVASAVALLLVGSAPLLLQACMTSTGEATPVGLGLAAVLTLGGAGGEIAAVAAAVRRTAPGANSWFVVAALAVAALLAVYAGRSTYINLVRGITPPAPEGELTRQEIDELSRRLSELREAVSEAPDEAALDPSARRDVRALLRASGGSAGANVMQAGQHLEQLVVESENASRSREAIDQLLADAHPLLRATGARRASAGERARGAAIL